MTRHTGYETAAAPKGAAFRPHELEYFERVPTFVRRAALKLATLSWLDLDDDDSVGSGLIVIGEKPMDYHDYKNGLVQCVRLLRRGPKPA